MIQIDKKDALYKYLTGLGVESVDEEYLMLANNGRYKLDDVRQFYRARFEPSQKDDIDESELEKVLDYYVDLKKVKLINSKEVKELLRKYKLEQDENAKNMVINAELKDVLYLCLNYKTMHKDVDVQDLVQVANIGLIQAVEKYNVETKIDIKDYIVYWVGKRLNEEFEENK